VTVGPWGERSGWWRDDPNLVEAADVPDDGSIDEGQALDDWSEGGGEIPSGPLRRGWTTGACATAATKAAVIGLFGGAVPDPVTVTLPRGETPAFALAVDRAGDGWHRIGIVKDAGDDPDVTHGATIVSTVRAGAPGTGIVFRAGDGVGTVTLPGLPLAVGDPAINPVPRQMMTAVVEEACRRFGQPADIEVELSVPGGEQIATHTWNPRLGIVGGLSILGTTGVVVPYSCSAWIASIHRGVDIARAAGHHHVAGCTGSTSEAAVQRLFALPDTAMLDMGDFVGGLLKYLRRHPVDRVTIGGGFAKLSKLAIGHLDLHSGRSQIDLDWMAERVADLGAAPILVDDVRNANTALAALELAGPLGPGLAEVVAHHARHEATAVLEGAAVAVDVVVVSRAGEVLATSPPLGAT
jgi:cobalt-precorrin-5B (C1)-methyltransferase